MKLVSLVTVSLFLILSHAMAAPPMRDEQSVDPQTPGITYPTTGRLQHTSRLTFNLSYQAVRWWKFSCPKAATSGGKDFMKKAVAGGAFTNPAEPGAKEISLHSTQISVKDFAGKVWPANEIRIEVRRVPTIAEIQAIAAGKPVQDTMVDVTFWATCID